MPTVEVKVAPSAPKRAQAEVSAILRQVNQQPSSPHQLSLDLAEDLALASDDLIIPETVAERIKACIIDGYGMDLGVDSMTLSCLGHAVNLIHRFGAQPDKIYKKFLESQHWFKRVLDPESSERAVSFSAFMEANLAALIKQGGESLIPNPNKRLAGAVLTGFANKIAAFSHEHLSPRQWREALTRISSEQMNNFLVEIAVPTFIIGAIYLPTRFTVYSLLAPKVSNENETKI